MRASSRFLRLAGHRLRLQPDVAERLRDVVGVAHAGGVDDARDPVEARLVEVGHREVERQLVEQLGQHLLVELGVHFTAAQRHLGDRAHARPRRDPHAAQRRDHPAAGGLGEVEARGLRREEIGDVAGDQRARRGHADEHRPGPGADRGGRLLAQRGVRLVADDDRVGVGDLARVADEPLVGLDGHRAVARVLVAEQRRRDPLGVAAVAQLAVELVDEVAAVGEDQDAAGPRRLDEAERGDGLAGAGGVLEPEALGGVGVVDVLGDLLVGVGPVDGILVAVLLLAQLLRQLLLAGQPRGSELDVLLRDGAVGLAVAVALRLREQRGQRAGQRVDLVGRQHGAVDERRLVLGEQAVEPQQQRPAAAPAGGGHLVALVELGQHGVERAPARSARRERGRGVLPFEQEGFTGERSRPLEIVGRWKGCDRQGRCLRLSHEGSTNRRREKSCGPPHDFEQARDRRGDGVIRRRLPGKQPIFKQTRRRPPPICHRISRCDGTPPSSPVSR